MDVRYWLFDKGWIVIIPLLIIISVIWIWPLGILNNSASNVEQINTDVLYLLSASAQSIAAILGLIITIPLIVIQLISRYSNRISSNYINKPVIIFIIVFVISILFTLWVIINPNQYAIKLSFSMTIICLFLLLPFFLLLKERLSPDKMISDLGEKISKNMAQNPTLEPDALKTLENIAMSALSIKDYEVFQNTIGAFGILLAKSWKLNQFRDERQSKYAYYMFANRFASFGAQAKNDPLTLVKMIEGLGYAYFSFTKNRFTEESYEIIDQLAKTAILAAQKEEYTAVKLAAEFLGNISTDYIKNQLLTYVDGNLEYIQDIGITAIKYGSHDELGLRDAMSSLFSEILNIKTRAKEILRGNNYEVVINRIASVLVRLAETASTTSEDLLELFYRRLAELGLEMTVDRNTNISKKCASDLQYLTKEIGYQPIDINKLYSKTYLDENPEMKKAMGLFMEMYNKDLTNQVSE